MKFYEEDEYKLTRRRRSEPDFWHRLNRVVMTLVVVGFLGTVAITFYPVWQKQHEMRMHLLSLERQVTDKTAALQQNQREIDLLRHDADYVETIARDRLNLMKPGETIYRVELPRS